jgi:cell division protein FtsI/penicillin-binding protein 2
MAERLEQRKQQVAESPGTRGRDSDRRIFWLKAGLLALFAVVVIRLLQIQVLESSKYREAARKQYEAKVPLPAFRGNICDRNGKVLVSNQMTVSFAADPKKIGDGDNAIAERFSRVFGRPVKFYQEKLADESRRFVYLERRMNAR